MKKNAKRIFSAVIAASLTLSMGVAAYAEQHTNITVSGGGGSGSSSQYVKPDKEPFTDVDENDWFYDDVLYVYENGLMKGTASDTFSPYATTTRGMIVTVLYRLEGEPALSAVCPFSDVASGSYYENAITWAAANGIVNGYGDGKFGPNDNITREQLAAIICRYAAFKGYDVAARGEISTFADFSKVDAWAVSAMSWAYAEGVIAPVNGLLDATVDATRAQAAAALHALCENVAE